MPWKINPPMVQARSHAAAASQGGRIYVMGGIGESPEALASVEIYDPKTERWSEGPALPTARFHLTAVTLKEHIFALGGKTVEADGSIKYLKTLEILNPSTQKWESGPDLLFFHAAGGGAEWRGIIYAVGGEDPEGTADRNPGTGSAERWDPLRKRWFEIAPLPAPRFGFALVGHNNRIIVMGGKTRERGKEIFLERSDAFETAQKSWEEYPLTRLPFPAAGLGASSMANLFIAGGESDLGVTDQIYSVDQLQRCWIKMDPLPEPRAYCCVLTKVGHLDNSLYVIGGRDANDRPRNTLFAFKT